MTQHDLYGIKHKCQYCNALFYDFNQSPIICPACQKIHDREDAMRLKRTHTIKADDTDEDSSDLNLTEESDDNIVLEDTSELESDNDIPNININDDNHGKEEI
ncbi:MAG: FYDLN acid domain-containing protein [Pseudomonadota bacterium]